MFSISPISSTLRISTLRGGGVNLGFGQARVLDESFLIATKTDTGRKSDLDDVTFLETKLPTELSARLSVCSMEEARSLFSRYLDPATREAALSNPDPAVRDMGLAGLAHLWSPFFQPRFGRDFSVGNGEATLRGKGQNPR